MLYDNALLARAYLHGWQAFGHERYRRVAEGTLDWMLREMRGRGGGLFSAPGAAPGGRGGRFFLGARRRLGGRGGPILRLDPRPGPRDARRQRSRAAA